MKWKFKKNKQKESVPNIAQIFFFYYFTVRMEAILRSTLSEVYSVVTLSSRGVLSIIWPDSTPHTPPPNPLFRNVLIISGGKNKFQKDIKPVSFT